MNAEALIRTLWDHMQSGAMEIVDLSGPLGPDTPLIKLPPEIGANTPRIEIHEISRFDDRGRHSAWNWLKIGEHSGTHFDAPQHWISGRHHADGATDTIPVSAFVAPANVIDCSAEAAENPDFLLTADRVRQWEAEHGKIGRGEWVLMRTDWYKRNGSEETFLNADERGLHSPGPDAACIRYVVETGAIGWGTETIGTDAGQAHVLDPPFPAHFLMHRANRYGLASLNRLDALPPKGALLVAAPLKIVGGTGSPIRALALKPC